MHLVLFLDYQMGPICQRHNIRQFVRGRANDGLQAHFPQQADTLYDAVTVHLIKRLVEHYQPDGIAG